jgi:cobalt/nickel transport system ATP-binding protein
MDALRLDSVSYSYPDGQKALKDISLAIGQGEKIALIGPNGAGKSTMLNIMATLLLPPKGRVEIMGHEVNRKNAAVLRRHMGYVFQDPDDQIFMPRVWDDVAFGPLNYGHPTDEVERRVEEALERTGLKGYEERAPHHLSFGEKKRVAIAGVLAISPDILLMDEPTANLDPQGKRDLVNILASLDTSLVIATHDLSVAFELADRAVVLKRSILFDGPVRELVEDEDTLREANLELPPLSRLMLEYRRKKGKDHPIPLTVEEALRLLP